MSVCGACGAELGAGSRFCSRCGAVASGEPEATATDASAPPEQAAAPTGASAASPPPPPPPATPPPVVQSPEPPTPVVVMQQGPSTSGFAIASMVLGILWLYWIGSILALVFGYVAKGQIDRSGGALGGRGMAIAGIVLGWIGVGILLLLLVVGVGVGVSA